MIHLGDITKINGAEIEPVDCITAGSPCQDLSVAGKRAGLEGERSGLFMEQIRIIKEMREHDRNNGRADEFVRPRYMVWENVPGAFSSNKGEDFRCVLEETAKVAERDAVIPGPPKGKWSKSGAIMGDGWSIAWRVHDAQFWGVPQRRKRIALVADFGGLTAPEILFERESVSGDIAESRKEGQTVAGTVESSTRKASGFNGWQSVTASMPIIDNGTPPIEATMPPYVCESSDGDIAGIGETSEPILLESNQNHATIQTNGISTSLPASMGMGGGYVPMITDGVGEIGGAISFQERAGKPGGGKGILIQNERTGALSTLNNQSVCCLNDQGGSQMGVTERANAGDNQQAVVTVEQQIEDFVSGVNAEAKHQQDLIQSDLGVARTLAPGTHASGSHLTKTLVTSSINTRDNQQAVVYGIGSYDSNAMKSGNPHSGIYEAETARTLDLNGGSPACNQGGMVVLEGNGSRPSHKGDGYAESETMYTLNSTEHHSVAYRKTSHAKSAEDGQGWAETEVNDTLNAFDSGETRTPTVIVDNKKTVYDWHRCDTRMTELGDTCNTMSASWGAGGNNMPYVLEAIGGEVAGTLDASYYKGCGERQGIERDVVVQTYQDTTGTLSPGAHAGSYNGQDAYNDMLIAATLNARDYKGPCTQDLQNDMANYPIQNSIVRRLTPLECERLQGFPDGWTDIGEWTDSKGKMRKCSDSARYKALGNSIALPFWFYLLRRISAQYERPATLGSLFDGIGGFPLCWERCNGSGTARWASEIEEFPIAVTRRWFGE